MTLQNGVQQPRAQYANYWENDTTANPVIVRLDAYDPSSDLQMVHLPHGGGIKQVHIHELGKPHYAW